MSTTIDSLDQPRPSHLPDPHLSASLSRPATLFRRIPWAWIACILLLLLYSAYIFTHYAPAITEPDDNGYFAQGTLWAQTGKTWFVPESDAQYIGMHWLITPSGQYISRYPPGLSVLIGVFYWFGGYTAAALVNPLLSIATLVAVFLITRKLSGPAWALAALAILGSNPTFVRHSLAGDSHMGVACSLAWGLWFLLKWADQPRLWSIFAAGIVLGCIPTIRYPDAIMGAGVILFILWNSPRLYAAVGKKIAWHYLAAFAGAMIPLTPLLIRNQLLMGAFWRTGYALTNEQTGFSWAYFNDHAINYIRVLNSDGLGTMLALGLLGITWMICAKRTRALGLMCMLMTIPMLLVYMAYYWAPQMNSAMTMRFLLPTFVVYVLAATWALSELCRNVTNGQAALRIVLPLVIVAVQLLWGTRETMDAANQLAYKKDGQARVAAALYAVTQQGDVVVAGNNVLQNLDFVHKWKLADQSLVSSFGRGFGGGGPGGGGGGFGGNRDPDAPSPMQAEKQEKRKELYTGTTRENRKKFAADVRTWAAGRKIYFVGAERELSALRNMGGDTHILQKISLPDPPPQRARESMMGGGMRGRGNAADGARGNAAPANNPNDRPAPGGNPPDPAPGGNPPGPGGPDVIIPAPADAAAAMPVPPQGGGFPGGGFPGGGFGGAGFGGGGGFGGRGGGGGGMMGGLGNEKELVIAEWILPEPQPN